jgi:5-amino-6-(5-phosphoribosylamino)uracil reductase
MIVIGKCAMTLDGFIDHNGDRPLGVSTREDGVEVGRLRLASDLILVGAQTVRRDNPSLLLRPEFAEARQQDGRPNLAKAVLTRTAALDSESRFFTTGETRKIVFHVSQSESVPSSIRAAAEVVNLRRASPIEELVSWCAREGMATVLVEGGGEVHTAFLNAKAYSGFRVAVGPFFAGPTGTTRPFRAASLALDVISRRFEVLDVHDAGQTIVTWLLIEPEARERVEDLIRQIPSP